MENLPKASVARTGASIVAPRNSKQHKAGTRAVKRRGSAGLAVLGYVGVFCNRARAAHQLKARTPVESPPRFCTRGQSLKLRRYVKELQAGKRVLVS